MKLLSKYIKLLLVFCITTGLMLPEKTASEEQPTDDKIFGAPPPAIKHQIRDPLIEQTMEVIPDWQARWELARLLSYVKRYSESIDHYRQVLKEKPDLLEAQIELANVLVWAGRPKDARTALETVPFDQLDDKNLLLLGDAYAAEKAYDRATAIYQRLLTRRPENHNARLRLAEVLSWQKKYTESISEYQKLLKAIPGDIQIRRKYAFILSWAGRQQEAINELKKTLAE